ncbi:MAG: hypothetical protein AB8U25_01375 [Rickettsiales endosymbiont of Dermacentor nuttalli]
MIYFDIPSFTKKLADETAISVEILPIKAISNLPNKTSQSQATKEESKNIVKASNSTVQDKPEIKEKTELKNGSNIKVAEKEKMPEVKNITKAPVPKTDVSKEEQKKEKPKEQTKNNKKVEVKAKVQNSELDSLLKTLDIPANKKTKNAKTNKQSSSEKSQNSKSDKEFDELQPLSLNEEASIRSQLYKCWDIPIGIKDIAKMSVVLKINLTQDGTVQHVKIIEENKPSKVDMSSFRAFLESTVRAVHKCSPLQNLSIEKYNAWREIELNFDPRDVVNS